MQMPKAYSSSKNSFNAGIVIGTSVKTIKKSNAVYTRNAVKAKLINKGFKLIKSINSAGNVYIFLAGYDGKIVTVKTNSSQSKSLIISIQ